jgi:AcrR family transcriptional regulator
MIRKRKSSIPRPGRMPRASGVATRNAILAAALGEFSTYGFAAVTTRMIAAAAGIEQGHLAYYFTSKELLWRATIARFNSQFEDLLALSHSVGADPAAVLRPLLRFFADNRQLSRLMLQEFSVQSERHDWLVSEFGRPAWKKLRLVFTSIAARRSVPTDPALLYFTFIGAALLFFGSSAEVAQIAGPGVATEEAEEAFIELQLQQLLQ